MATINDLAVEYAEYIRINRDSPYVASEIAERISRLTYTTSGQPLSLADKDALVSALRQELQHPTTGAGRILRKGEDISALLAMVDKIRGIVGKGRV